jgi:hypothetical protein
MKNGTAYRELAAELESWRSRPPSELVSAIGQPRSSRVVEAGGEQMMIEVGVAWTSEKREAVRISATAYGSSHLRVERQDEAVVVSIPRQLS